MNTYRITGAVKETGADYAEFFQCENEDAAREYASQKGVLVSEITLCNEPMPTNTPAITRLTKFYEINGTQNGKHYSTKVRMADQQAARYYAATQGVTVNTINYLTLEDIHRDVLDSSDEYLTVDQRAAVVSHMQLIYVRKISFWVTLWSILSIIAFIILILVNIADKH